MADLWTWSGPTKGCLHRSWRGRPSRWRWLLSTALADNYKGRWHNWSSYTWPGTSPSPPSSTVAYFADNLKIASGLVSKICVRVVWGRASAQVKRKTVCALDLLRAHLITACRFKGCMTTQPASKLCLSYSQAGFTFSHWSQWNSCLYEAFTQFWVSDNAFGEFHFSTKFLTDHSFWSALWQQVQRRAVTGALKLVLTASCFGFNNIWHCEE